MLSVIGYFTGPEIEVDPRLNNVAIKFTNNTSVKIKATNVMRPRKGVVVFVDWEAPSDIRLGDCINLGIRKIYNFLILRSLMIRFKIL